MARGKFRLHRHRIGERWRSRRRATERGSDVSVLLLEAGSEDDDDMIHLPAGWSTLFKTKWDWGYQTTP